MVRLFFFKFFFSRSHKTFEKQRFQHTRPVTNKLLVSLNISINFSASTNHSLSDSFSQATRVLLTYEIPLLLLSLSELPLLSTAHESNDSEDDCQTCPQFFSSGNNDALDGLTESSVWFAVFDFPRFLRESITAIILVKKAQEPFVFHPVSHKSQPVSASRDSSTFLMHAAV